MTGLRRSQRRELYDVLSLSVVGFVEGVRQFLQCEAHPDDSYLIPFAPFNLSRRPRLYESLAASAMPRLLSRLAGAGNLYIALDRLTRLPVPLLSY